MADFDSDKKRWSGIHVGSPWRCIIPMPDGEFVNNDRQVLGYLYQGIDFSSSTPASSGAIQKLNAIQMVGPLSPNRV